MEWMAGVFGGHDAGAELKTLFCGAAARIISQNKLSL
jgi:hypothetical protein